MARGWLTRVAMMTTRRTSTRPPLPTPRELLGRGCLFAIWLTAETLVQLERIAFRGEVDEGGAR
jgi:hypothetical protein